MKRSLLILNLVSLCGFAASGWGAIAFPSRANAKPVESAVKAVAAPVAKPIVKTAPTPIVTLIETPKVSNLTAIPATTPVTTPIAKTAVTPVTNSLANPASLISSNEVKILSPTTQSVTGDRAATIVLQYSQGKSISLVVNGAVIDPKQIGRTETNSVTRQITQTWYGVEIGRAHV